MNIQFLHGLGDAVQLSIVLKHIPEQTYIKTNRAFQSLYQPITNDLEPKKILFSGGIWEDKYKHLPPTKVTRCLVREFNIVPDPSLYSYELPRFTSEIAKNYLSDKGKYILIHANGVTSRNKKDMTDEEILYFIQLVKYQGFTPILLDFYNYLTHIDCERTNIPFSIETLSHLLIHAERLIGIDSGPEHMSLAYGTPTSVIWKEWCPFHNIDPHPCLDNWITNDAFKYFNSEETGRLSEKLDPIIHKYNISYYRKLNDIKIFN